jgi:hypothetical protein
MNSPQTSNTTSIASMAQNLTKSPLSWSVRLAIFISALCGATLLLTNNLDTFPLYFFCDEAIHGAEAQSLINFGHDTTGVRWPLFFQAYGSYHISLSVYLHLLIQLFLPASEFAVRLIGVFSGLLFIVALTVLMHRFLNLKCKRYPSDYQTAFMLLTAPYIISISPFFYLHFRTGFEIVIALCAWIWGIVAFDIAFDSNVEPRRGLLKRYCFGFLSTLALSASFYIYTPARGWVPLSIAVLILSYIPRIRKQLWLLIFTLSALAIFTLPYIITTISNPEIGLGRLQVMGITSYDNINSELLNASLERALEVSNPRYWLSWGNAPYFESFARHTIPGLPLLPRFLGPFVILGCLTLLTKCRSSCLARALIMLYPIGIFPAALVAVNPLRCAPIGVLLLIYGLIGIYSCAAFMSRLPVILESFLIYLSTGAVLVYSVHFQQYIFGEAQFLYADYGFYGVQMGEKKIFSKISELINQGKSVNMTHEGFNGARQISLFYLSNSQLEHFKIREVALPCLLPENDPEGLWLVREERYQEFLSAQEACNKVSAVSFYEVKTPTDKVLFRFLELSHVRNKS